MTTETIEEHPRPPARTKKLRCGFCADGKHGDCCIAVRWGKHGERVWRCACTCETATTGTRCLDCGRKGREVTDRSVCVDQDECRGYIQSRRRDYMAELTGQPQPEGDDTPRRLPKHRTPARGQCLCCGTPTRGGKFLPGHDAKWLSTQIKTYLETGDNRVEQQVREISSALHAKFVARTAQARP